MRIGMVRETAVVLLLATACGNNNDGTAGVGATDTQASTGDTSGSTAGDPTSGASDSDSATPTTSAGSNSGASNSGDTDDTTTTGTTESTSTTVPSSDSDPDTTTTSTSATTDDTGDSTTLDSTTGEPDTTMGVDTTGSSGTTDGPGTTGSTTGEPDTTTGDIPCGSLLKATIRDFAFAHPDFENFGGNNAHKGLVQVDLGPDKKPVYAHPGATPQTSGPAQFNQWYNDTPGVNHTFQVDLPLTEIMPGLYQFADNTFFPIDGLGFGNEGQPNNFAFTTEIHTQFAYNGGEIFTFIGDDDVWVFINGKLALDLGGLHPQLTDSINLDAQAAALGITPGFTYDMDIFHAERHTDQSNFRIDTTIACFLPQ